MGLSKELISEFIKVTNDSTNKKNDTTVYATIVESGGEIGAKFDGSDVVTPVSTTAEVKDGDRVIVTVRNHEAIVTGSTSAPAAAGRDVAEIGKKILEVDELIASKVETEYLEAKLSEIGTLIANKVDVEYLEAESARIEQLIAGKVSTDYLESETARIENLIAGKVSADDLDAKYAKIDFANVKELDVENLLVRGSFLVDDINAATGSFSKYLTGVNIVGDNITAGTITTDRLVIRDPDKNTGILFAINNGIVAQEGLSEEALKRLTLNGQVITAESITADKINVTDLFAQYIKAKNIHITDDSTFENKIVLDYGAEYNVVFSVEKQELSTGGYGWNNGEFALLGGVSLDPCLTIDSYHGMYVNGSFYASSGVFESVYTQDVHTNKAYVNGGLYTNNNIYLSKNADGIFTGGKTTYGEGKEGVHIRKNGRIYMEGGSVTPGLYFYHGGQTSNGAHIIYDSTTDYLKFNNASQYTFGSTIKVNNGVAYTSVDSAGTGRRNLIWLASTNNLFIGGGSYPPDYIYITPGSGFWTEVQSSLVVQNSVFTGSKTGTDDGVTGGVLSSTGRLHLQNTTGNPTINFYGNSTSMGSRISYDIANDSLNMTSASGYSFDNDVYFNSSTLYVTESIRIGSSDTSSSLGTRAIGSIWKDGSHHYIVARNDDGLTAAFGWAGTSSYASVALLRGRTVKYQNSNGTTTLSDERLKKDFISLDRYDKFFDALEPCAFRMKGGNSGRYHIGFKARQVEQALLDNGLTTQDFAGFIRMAYKPDPDDPEGNAVYEEAGIKEGDDEFGLIYTEFPALNAAQIQKLKRRVARIEAALGISDVM